MNEILTEMPEVTVELSEAELEAIEERAFDDHRGNREAAIRTLLTEWLESREQ